MSKSITTMQSQKSTMREPQQNLLAKEKQIDDMESWIIQWTPLIRRIALSFGLRDTDEDDWIQVSRLTYWEVYDKFIDGKGKSFNSFVIDMIKFRLIDMKRAESNLNRFWLRETVSIDNVKVSCHKSHYDTTFMDLSVDANVILRLAYDGYSMQEIRKLGIPLTTINSAKDEFVKILVAGGGDKMVRTWLEERAKELGIVIKDNELDYDLATRILSHGKSAKRKFVIVAPPSEEIDAPKCIATGCNNTAIDGSKFCSLSCADQMYRDMKKTQVKVKRLESSSRSSEFSGEQNEQSIRDLPNPFPPSSAAFEVFELFRTGGSKEILLAEFVKILASKNMVCMKPIERIRRVITDTRRLGYELKKSKGGFFRLTGRRR